jgi:exonuclease SbcD
VQHYQELIQKANSSKPLLATGHLSLLGARQSGSEREIYIGNLASLSASFFSEHFAYTALGHFHTFQEVAPNVFYSGSAIPLNFKEAKEQKYILVHDTHSQTTQKIPIPLFRPLVTVKSQEELQNVPKDAWVEVVLENESFIDTSGYEVLAIKKPSCKQKKSIKNFSPQELFASLVSKEADKEELQKLFEKILQEVELGHEDY